MRCARYLRGALQLQPGDRISRSRCPICCNTPSAFSGALKAGLVIVQVPIPQLHPFENRHQFFRSGARALIVLDSCCPLVRKISGRDEIEKLIVTAWRHDPAVFRVGMKEMVGRALCWRFARASTCRSQPRAGDWMILPCCSTPAVLPVYPGAMLSQPPISSATGLQARQL